MKARHQASSSLTVFLVFDFHVQPGAGMPKLLMSGTEHMAAPLAIGPAKKAAKQDKAILAILVRSTAKTWKQDQARVLEMLKGNS